MRLVIQSRLTGAVLVPSMDGSDPYWCTDLRQVGAGVLPSVDYVAQLIEDHCDPEMLPQVVDLDRLGTANDYADI
jgi:hypothetical protein